MNYADYSVVIPTRNRASFLMEAIDSIIKQKKVSIEIIVVDDYSDDNTEEIIKRYSNHVKYYRNSECKFAHASRKIGYGYAQGKYVVFMDDDDFYVDNTFFFSAKQIMDKNDNISMVIGSTVTYEDGEYNQILDLKGDGVIERKEYINNFSKKYNKPASTLTCIFRRESLDKYNLKHSLMVNDTCLYLRGVLAGDVCLINKAVGAYRIHSNNISKKRFSNEFMDLCLSEKKRIFTYAKEEDLLENPKEWLNFQISISGYYFICSSSYSIVVVLRVMRWVLLFGKGIRLRFLKDMLIHIR